MEITQTILLFSIPFHIFKITIKIESMRTIHSMFKGMSVIYLHLFLGVGQHIVPVIAVFKKFITGSFLEHLSTVKYRGIFSNIYV